MNRRSFLGILAGLAASVVAPFKAKATVPDFLEIDSVITKLVPAGDDLLIFGSDGKIWALDVYNRLRLLSGNIESLGGLGKGE